MDKPQIPKKAIQGLRRINIISPWHNYIQGIKKFMRVFVSVHFTLYHVIGAYDPSQVLLVQTKLQRTARIATSKDILLVTVSHKWRLEVSSAPKVLILNRCLWTRPSSALTVREPCAGHSHCNNRATPTSMFNANDRVVASPYCISVANLHMCHSTWI